MATVTLTHRWADGSLVQVEVKVGRSYPDELHEARATAVDALREVIVQLEDETSE